MKPMVYDVETSISKTRIHKPGWKNLDTDIYTVISGANPDSVTIEHKENGFNRDIGGLFDECDTIVGANLHFDLGYIFNTDSFRGFLERGGTIYDVSEAEYILSGQRHKYPSLAELQLIYLGQKEKKDRISYLYSKGIGADIIISKRDKCPRLWKLYEQYCYDDGITTLQIFKKQWERAKKEGCLPLIKMRMKALLAVISMECEGMHLDVAQCEERLKEYRLKALKHLENATKLVEHLWDERLGALNINSPKQKSAILFGGEFKIKEKEPVGFYKNGNPKFKTVEKTIEIKGFELDKSSFKVGKSGLVSTDNSTVIKLHKTVKDPVIKEYLEEQVKAMNTHKMCSTYLEPFLKYSIDGKLYPNYNTTGTQTGRLSAEAPSLQNVPSSGPLLKDIQGLLVAPEGWICLSLDYSQLEPFVTAMLTKDHNLTQDLLTGVCLHCRALSWVPSMSEGKTYEEIYKLAKIDEDPKWVLKRKKAKGVNFKRAYGGGARSLAESEDIPIEDVQAIFDAQDTEYAQVKEYIDNLYNKLTETQQISRKMHYSKSNQRGRMFRDGLELLPIFDINSSIYYNPETFRYFSQFTTIFGHKFSFEETGNEGLYGFKRGYSTTETKNYWVQGSAGDIVCMSLAKCMNYTLKNYSEVRMVRQIHDEIGFYVKNNDNLKLHIGNISAIMIGVKSMCKEFLNVEVPFDFQVGISIGKNFGELEVYKLEN